MKYPFYYWIAVLFYLCVLALSNFALTEILSFYPMGFGTWFLLFLFAFSFGMLICYLFGMKLSLWIIGISWFAISFFSFIIVAVKPSVFYLETFGGASALTQILKIALTTCFAIFGTVVYYSYKVSKDIIKATEKIRFYEKNIIDAKQEAELLKREAMVNANEMVFDAKKKVQELEKIKRELEIKIREFLQTELAVLEKHEEGLKE
ncbi:MAG: hypothetical protein FJ213_05850 [Ignavibacteria bacterium]|nr:hypothetical protein [Ignavibacteria bacterium]